MKTRTVNVMVLLTCSVAAIAILAGNPAAAIAQAWAPVSAAAVVGTTSAPNTSRVLAREAEPTPLQATTTSAAKPSDVDSLDAIMSAVYDVISGPAGQKRDWDRMRSLFVPGAHLIPVAPDKAGVYGTQMYDVDGYVGRASSYFEKAGFFEREVARKIEVYGQIAHVFSTYESRHKADDAAPFERGINSFQLMNDGTRWWVVNIFWEGETAGGRIPEKYLTGKH
jgi:hypothetical protein